MRTFALNNQVQHFPASVHIVSFMSKANISVWGGVLVYAFTKSLIGYKDVF